MVKTVLLITTVATLLLAVSGLEQHNTFDIKNLKPGHKFYKGDPQERELRDKLLDIVRKDPEAGFDILNDIREDNGHPRIQKRDNILKSGHKNSKGTKGTKGTKDERELREKMLEYVKKDEAGAFELLTDIREGKADLSKHNVILKKRDTRTDSGHKIFKGDKDERELRAKLLSFVKKDEAKAFELLTDIREGKVNLSEHSVVIKKRDTPMEPGHKIFKGNKDERALRDKMLEFVKNDEENAFKLLNDLRAGKADLSNIAL
jgi:hypothetical protein